MVTVTFGESAGLSERTVCHQVECSLLPHLGHTAPPVLPGATGPVKVQVPLVVTPCCHAGQLLSDRRYQPPMESGQPNRPGSFPVMLGASVEATDGTLGPDVIAATRNGLDLHPSGAEGSHLFAAKGPGPPARVLAKAQLGGVSEGSLLAQSALQPRGGQKRKRQQRAGGTCKANRKGQPEEERDEPVAAANGNLQQGEAAEQAGPDLLHHMAQVQK